MLGEKEGQVRSMSSKLGSMEGTCQDSLQTLRILGAVIEESSDACRALESGLDKSWKEMGEVNIKLRQQEQSMKDLVSQMEDVKSRNEVR